MTVLDDTGTFPLVRIPAQIRWADVARLLVTLTAAVLFGAGWLGAKAVGIGWLVLTWSAAAVRLGWQDGRGTTPSHRRT